MASPESVGTVLTFDIRKFLPDSAASIMVRFPVDLLKFEICQRIGQGPVFLLYNLSGIFPGIFVLDQEIIKSKPPPA